MPKLYLMPNGSIAGKDGSPVQMTQEQFEECCCAADCCSVWPPEAGKEEHPRQSYQLCILTIATAINETASSGAWGVSYELTSPIMLNAVTDNTDLAEPNGIWPGEFTSINCLWHGTGTLRLWNAMYESGDDQWDGENGSWNVGELPPASAAETLDVKVWVRRTAANTWRVYYRLDDDVHGTNKCYGVKPTALLNTGNECDPVGEYTISADAAENCVTLLCSRLVIENNDETCPTYDINQCYRCGRSAYAEGGDGNVGEWWMATSCTGDTPDPCPGCPNIEENNPWQHTQTGWGSGMAACQDPWPLGIFRVKNDTDSPWGIDIPVANDVVLSLTAAGTTAGYSFVASDLPNHQRLVIPANVTVETDIAAYFVADINRSGRSGAVVARPFIGGSATRGNGKFENIEDPCDDSEL